MRDALGSATAHGRRIRSRALRSLIRGEADPNDRRWGRGPFEGVCLHAAVDRWAPPRAAPASACWTWPRGIPDRLRIEIDALATRVLIDDGGRANGVEYLQAASGLYRAHPNAARCGGELRRGRAAPRGDPVAGGAFNTPQLLMLSGIGPSRAPAAARGAVRVDLPGVGQNLQDRYEIGVVNKMARPWEVLDGRPVRAGRPLVP